MTYYKPIKSPFYRHVSTNKQVSFYGAAPIPIQDYVVDYRHSLECTDSRGNVTAQNYFFGEVIRSGEQAEDFAKRLNDRNKNLKP